MLGGLRKAWHEKEGRKDSKQLRQEGYIEEKEVGRFHQHKNMCIVLM